MRRSLVLLSVLWSFTLLTAISAGAMEDEYPVPPEGEVQDGVPQGKVEGPFEFRSSVFPGTVREYWVYVPAQCDAEKPPCLMIVQDGLGMAKNWRLPTVLDNMIHSGEVPMQLGIFVGHGSDPWKDPVKMPKPGL
jgi:gluconolactonase